MRRFTVAAATLALALLLSAVHPFTRSSAAGGSTLDRPEDPVVLTGANVPTLTGIIPHDLVAFRWDGGWTQIPVQVDERDMKTFTTVYNGAVTSSVSELFYTDPNTWTGPDSDPTFDSNDEVAFMAKDAGGQAPSFALPPNTVPGYGVQITINDPLAALDHGWVYLFRSDGTLDPAAGQSYVSYSFSLNSGNYKSTYTLGDTHPALAGNPENSTVTTPDYSLHFGDRWQDDGLDITVGGATGVDILDRHKPLFAPGNCGRTEDTFDGYINTTPIEGAFVANISGPVRAIRSYVGANSGPRTGRDEIFYAQREDIRTYLRVHPIPSIMDLFDYSPAASGMTYYNDLNTGGVTIDGVPDSLTLGPITWQMVAGAQGSLVISGKSDTNIPGFAYTSYYEDNKTNPVAQCTGDAFAYGTSGVYVNAIPGGIPCTDPGLGCSDYLNSTNTLYFEPPSQSVATAQDLSARANAPLTFAIQDINDTDDDGCTDAKELLLSPPTDPNNPWDFYSVPVPALFAASNPLGLVRDSAVTAGDAQAVFAYFKAGAHTGASVYEQDLNANGVRDGIEYDRSVAGPGMSGPPDGVVSASDAQLAFAQFKEGYHC